MSSSSGPPSNRSETPADPDRSKSEAFVAHWRTLPREGLVPSLQSYFDCADPDVQPDVAIVDLLPGNKLDVRLYGTGRVKTFNHNFTRETDPLFAYPDTLKAKAIEMMTLVITCPCGVRARVRFQSSKGRRDLHTVSALLPLRNEVSGLPAVVHHQYLIEDAEPGEYPVRAVDFTEFEFIDIGAGLPDATA